MSDRAPAPEVPLVNQATWRRIASVLEETRGLLRGGVNLESQEAVYAVAAMATAARELARDAEQILDLAEDLYLFSDAVRAAVAATRRGPVWTSWVGLAAAARQDPTLARRCLVELHYRGIAVARGYHRGPVVDPMTLQLRDEFCLDVDGPRLLAFMEATGG